MNTIYSDIQALLKSKMTDTTSLTAAGREGFGNCNLRVHYGRDNLVTKVLHRHDLSKEGRFGEPAVQYQSNMALEQQHPWTRLDGSDILKLANVPATLQCEDNLFLDESREINRAILNLFDERGFKVAFVRKWTAQGKGIGLEVIVVIETEEEFGVYECSMNYYIMPDTMRLQKDLLEIHRKRTGSPAAATAPAEEGAA
ncbi:hypothetical protein D9M68_18540 [compost metagenome]